MNESAPPVDELLAALKERAKELNCLYQVEELLSDGAASLEDQLRRIVDILPQGWTYPEYCQARIFYDAQVFQRDDFKEPHWRQSADICLQNSRIGTVEVSYPASLPVREGRSPFLPEEKRLIVSIATRLEQKILHTRLDPLFSAESGSVSVNGAAAPRSWRVVLDLISATDRELFVRLPRRMLNYLCYSGIEEAHELMETLGVTWRHSSEVCQLDGTNRPLKRSRIRITPEVTEQIFDIAARHLGDDTILSYIQKWIGENKFSALLNVLEDSRSTIHDIVNALSRYQPADFTADTIPTATVNAIKVALIRRFISRRLEVINVAKRSLRVTDFFDLAKRLIYPANSDGQIGGKGSGLFMAANALASQTERFPELADIKIPKTWCVLADGLLDFTNHNLLQEMREHKYNEIEFIRLEYDNIVQLFKSSTFSPEIIKGLSMALDDFGERPLIVRSSSLLEDSVGASFSGKYKSLFLANQGPKQERLSALQDAIAEVYASLYAPDPMEYRAERGLLDFQEEMGVLIQEVVGTRVGRYLFPAFGGVAFSRNEFRWSSRIRHTDGLIRLVPGLGTRAVDRLGDDYPILISPGQPQLRVNPSVDETVRYAPRFMDVINLETNAFETVAVETLLKQCGTQFPRFREVFSVYRNDALRIPGGLVDVESDFCCPTFEGLARNTAFVNQIKAMLTVLEEHYETPIDIEFAADDKDLYLLQCRSQSATKGGRAAAIPADLDPRQIVFTARRYVSNGHVPDITHIVYVVPEAYDALDGLEALNTVGRIISRLNKILPKRQFILIGPGRWGSRGDIKLGVRVTYSDINNTAVLIEVAHRRGTYQPELSFGTHFFQDLVEAAIRYLPLYPDERGNIFNQDFLMGSANMLPALLPQFNGLAHVVRVIDVPRTTDGLVLTVLMNGDEGRAVAHLTAPTQRSTDPPARPRPAARRTGQRIDHWKWRLHMAERIAAAVDAPQMGVKAMYVFGSTKNGTAGPKSDIDLLIHFEGSADQRKALLQWLKGWSQSLAAVNQQRTGYPTAELLDVHLVTDADIARKTSWALKIDSLSDAAHPLVLGK